MYDRVSNLGVIEISAPAVLTAGGAGSGVLNLINTQAQGSILFILDSANPSGAQTLAPYLQTSADNSNWSNVNTSTAVLQVQFNQVNNGNSGGSTNTGVQSFSVDSSLLLNYNRFNDAVTGVNAGNTVTRSITAVFPVKNK